MEKLKVCFVGIGSIAKRHIRNLNELCGKKKINLRIDAFRRMKKIDEEMALVEINNFYYNVAELPKDYDVIFLTNPTEYHLEMLEKLHNHGKHFFIEKPITSYAKLEEVHKVVYRKDSIYYIACPLRYTKVIEYLKENLSIEDVISVRCICSSYLPEWRPNVDYRKTYSANKALGGGVSIDLIHEWDYLKFLFGNPKNVMCMSGKVSDLEIDSEDYAIYIARYEKMILELHLDYFGRKSMRNIQIFTNDDIIMADLIESKIIFMKENKVIELSQDRDDYQKKELEYFLDMVDGKVNCNNNIEDAYSTMLLTLGKC